jgi:hypothetical protein
MKHQDRLPDAFSTPLNNLRHLSLIGKTSEPFLREEELALIFDFKYAAARFNEFRFNAKFSFKFVRQSDGLRSIVSNPAIRNFTYIHGHCTSAQSNRLLKGDEIIC